MPGVSRPSNVAPTSTADPVDSKFVSRDSRANLITSREADHDDNRPRSKRHGRRRTPLNPRTPTPTSSGGDGRRSRNKQEQTTSPTYVGKDPQDHDPDQPITNTKHLSPMQRRPKPSENYEKPISGRELWWRSTIRETPAPGSYELDNFVGHLDKRVTSYGFKSDGRNKDPQPFSGKGKYLLPGAYEYEDMAKRVAGIKLTYSFKNTAREDRDMMTFGQKDKDINISPNAYSMESYMTIQADKQPSKHWNFKSGTTRFPTYQFKPREGPGPGTYEDVKGSALHTVSSSFKSKTPRFTTSHTKTPGPGTYTSTVQCPLPPTVASMGRLHGIFFSSAFKA